jgi:hypothetical protein
MKMISLILVIAGLILGPAYWIYAKFYTGSELVNLPLSATPHATTGLLVWQSASFDMNESVAPIGLILSAQGQFSPNMEDRKPPKNAYGAILHRDGEASAPLNFSLGASSVSDSNPVFREHLLLMHKVIPGKYHLTVEARTPDEIKIDKMALQVRQNLHEPDPRVVTGGVVLFILGILALVVS